MNFLTELREGLLIAWSAICANKLRSMLTTLGIIIGVITVTLMGTAIQGMNNQFMSNISSIGADVLYVEQRGWFYNSEKEWRAAARNPRISYPDFEMLERELTLAAAIAPVAQDSTSVKYFKRKSDSVPAIGSTEAYLNTSGLTVAAGRFLSAAECGSSGRPVCVIGASLGTNLFVGESPLGQKISLEKREFEVVGVLAPQGGFDEAGGADNSVILPLPQFIAVIWDNPGYQIQVKAASLADLDNAKEEVRAVLRRHRHLAPNVPDNFSIMQQNLFLEMFHKIAGTIGGIGLFITGLSLFVGGIGIMNIMFVSVTERTREIGVRKAIGAKRRTILLQFITEAACICIIGGLVALLIAWPATLLMRQASIPATLSPLIVGISLLVSAVTGILSGFFPAWRAARMNPVDALRNE
jgi:putative ABC transport system permease protein